MAEVVYLDYPVETEALLESLSAPVRNWFKDKFPDFTAPQKLAIPAIQAQEHLLLCSPTGSGKTLTAFLSIIDQLVRKALEGELEKFRALADAGAFELGEEAPVTQSVELSKEDEAQQEKQAKTLELRKQGMSEADIRWANSWNF